jgi:hypothetical protein
MRSFIQESSNKIIMAVSKLIWYEEPWLKCMASLDPSSPGVTFVIYDEKGNEFEITAPRYSFNVNPAGSSQQMRAGNKIVRVGTTEIGYVSDRVNRIGRNYLQYNGLLLVRIGTIGINYMSANIVQVGRTRLQYNGKKVVRVGNASVTYSGDTAMRIDGNVK